MTINGNIWKVTVGVAVPLGAVIAVAFATWISDVSAAIAIHDDQGFHEGVRELVSEATRLEREWNESENWQQEQRFDARFAELRGSVGELRQEVAEATTLMRVLEERTRPDQ